MSKYTMPTGMKSIIALKADGFYEPQSDGMPLQGLLMGLDHMKGEAGKTRVCYQVKLTEPHDSCMMAKKDGKGWAKGKAAVGQIINVDARAGLKGLMDYAEGMPETYAVWIRSTQKISIKGGKTFWQFEAGAEEMDAGDVPDEDEMPF